MVMAMISKNYGKALVELDITFDDIESLRELFKKSPELLNVLLSPAVSLGEKEKIVNRVIACPEDKVLGNFLKVLIRRNRLSILDEILNWGEKFLLEGKATRTVTLSYVTMPSDLQLENITEILKEKLNCQKIQWVFQEDPGLIGGFCLDAGDMFFDYSIRGQLNEMREKITGR